MELWYGQGLQGAGDLGDAEQGAAHHVLLLPGRQQQVYRADQHRHEGLRVAGAEAAAQELEAVEGRLPVDSLLLLLLGLTRPLLGSMAQDTQKVSSERKQCRHLGVKTDR